MFLPGLKKTKPPPLPRHNLHSSRESRPEVWKKNRKKKDSRKTKIRFLLWDEFGEHEFIGDRREQGAKHGKDKEKPCV